MSIKNKLKRREAILSGMPSARRAPIQPLITVVYVFVGNLSVEDAEKYMRKVIVSLKPIIKPGEYPLKTYFIPTKDGDSRIEVLNPQPVSDKVYSKILAKMDEVDDALNEITQDKFFKE
jgi:hypothetical protein